MVEIMLICDLGVHILVQIASRGTRGTVVAIRHIAANSHLVMPDRAIIGVNVVPILSNRLVVRIPLRRCRRCRQTSHQPDKAQGREAR